MAAWGAKEFGSLTRKVRKLRERLTRLRAQSVGRGPSDEEKAVTKQLRLALKQEEIWIDPGSRGFVRAVEIQVISMPKLLNASA